MKIPRAAVIQTYSVDRSASASQRQKVISAQLIQYQRDDFCWEVHERSSVSCWSQLNCPHFERFLTKVNDELCYMKLKILNTLVMVRGVGSEVAEPKFSLSKVEELSALAQVGNELRIQATYSKHKGI